jgi:hypothetical protein
MAIHEENKHHNECQTIGNNHKHDHKNWMKWYGARGWRKSGSGGLTRFSLGEIGSVQVLVEGGSESSSACSSVSAGVRGSEHRGKSEIVLQTLIHRQECSGSWAGRRAIPVTAFAVGIGVHQAEGFARMSASEPSAASTHSIFSSHTPFDLV